MLSSFGQTFMHPSAEIAELQSVRNRIPLSRVPTFVKVAQVVRIDSMVPVTLTDTDYGHALKWDLAVSVITRRGMTVLWVNTLTTNRFEGADHATRELDSRHLGNDGASSKRLRC